MELEDKIKKVVELHEKKTGESIKNITYEKTNPVGFTPTPTITVTVKK